MEKQISYERILIATAIVICAFIIGYNAFFIPNINEPTVIYVDENTQNSSSEVKDKDIESKEEYEPKREVSDETTISSSSFDSIININTASADDIANANLSGIGAGLAKRIVEYRDSNGKFNNIEEIINVNGISEKTFEKIKNNICV